MARCPKTTYLIIIAVIVAFISACPNDSLCLQCRNNVCTFCAYSYPDSTGLCKSPSQIIPGCYSYSTNTQCAQCQDGYYFNLNASSGQACTPLDNSISAFCRYSMISTKACSACRNNVLQNGGGCIPGNLCADPNCDSCYYDSSSGNQDCMACNKGFVLWSGTVPNICIAANNLDNCASMYTLNTCDKCLPGTYWQNGVCSKNRDTRFGFASAFSMTAFFILFAIFLKN